MLELPKGSRRTPVEGIVVNYEPEGHPPPGIYSVPHFDLHFYLFDEGERASIAAPLAEERCETSASDGTTALQPLDCEVFGRATRPLPAAMMPPGYADVAAVSAGMGDHLIDLGAPEFNGKPFTHTWIYGAWDGEIGFLEPMVTVQYVLELQRRECHDYALPEEMAEAGFYPTRYCMGYDASSDSYRFSLERWMYLTAGDDGRRDRGGHRRGRGA